MTRIPTSIVGGGGGGDFFKKNLKLWDVSFYFFLKKENACCLCGITDVCLLQHPPTPSCVLLSSHAVGGLKLQRRRNWEGGLYVWGGGGKVDYVGNRAHKFYCVSGVLIVG